MNPQESKPLINIAESGNYVLKLFRPKDDEGKAKRFGLSKPDDNGKQYATASIFFMDGDNRCLTMRYSMQWESQRKAIATLVGRYTGKWSPAPPENITPENLYRFVEPAFGKIASVELTATLSGEWQGRPQYKYRFTKIDGASAPGRDIYKPAPEVPAAEQAADPFEATDSGAIPF